MAQSLEIPANPFSAEEEAVTPRLPILNPLSEYFEFAEDDPVSFVATAEIGSEVHRLIGDARLLFGNNQQASALRIMDTLRRAGEFYITTAINAPEGDLDTRQIISDNVAAFITAGNKFGQWSYNYVEINPTILERIYRVFDQNYRWANAFGLKKMARENLNNRIIVGRDVAIRAFIDESDAEGLQNALTILTEQRDSVDNLLKEAEAEWSVAQADRLSEAYNVARAHVVDYHNNIAVIYTDLAWMYRDRKGSVFSEFSGRAIGHLNAVEQILEEFDGVSIEQDAEKLTRALSNKAHIYFMDIDRQRLRGVAAGILYTQFMSLYGQHISAAVHRLHSYPDLHDEFLAEVTRRLAEGFMLYIQITHHGSPGEIPRHVTVFDTQNLLPTTVNLTSQTNEQLLDTAQRLLELSAERTDEKDDEIWLKKAQERMTHVSLLVHGDTDAE